jgi:hypothetical protein
MAMTNNIAQWIDSTVKTSDSQWLALVFRADGFVTNGHFVSQTPWSQSATCSIELLKTALSWTITECRRHYCRSMRFVGYLGGEPAQGVFPHIHAIIELPNGVSQEDLVLYLSDLWAKKIKKKFRQYISSEVLSQPLKNSAIYASYASRYEGTTFCAGDEKVIINNSFFL